MEDIRVNQYNTLTDFYYSMLAFKAKYEDRSEAMEFDDPDDLEAYLKAMV
jgi:hypothetical protein